MTDARLLMGRACIAAASAMRAEIYRWFTVAAREEISTASPTAIVASDAPANVRPSSNTTRFGQSTPRPDLKAYDFLT